MAFNGFKGFLAEHMFDPAGILGSSGLIHPQRNQPLGE